MPTYSYRCSKCEKIFDAFHSMMCSDPQKCPECGAEGKKLMSASSVIFKGSGFYSTDYRDSGYLEAKKKDSDKPAESSGGNGNGKETKTETKSETKTETKADPAPKAEAAKPAATAPVAQAA